MPRPDPLARGLVLLLAALLLLAGCAGDPAGTRSHAGAGGAGSKGSAPGEKYVAIGDSYSAGSLIPVTDVANGCFRSDHNYPSLVAEALHARLSDHTCSGAVTASFDTSQYPDVPPQRDGLGQDTSLVTVGLGGNDGGVFRSLIEECPRLRADDPSGSPCRDHFAATGTDALLADLARTRTALTSVLRQVRSLAPHATVLAIGYPQIIDAAHVCARLPLARGDYAYAEQVNRALTETVRQAAAAAGVTYVDVWSISRGHDICSSDPWINGAAEAPGRAPRYHPFAAEHVAVAKLVEQVLRSP